MPLEFSWIAERYQPLLTLSFFCYFLLLLRKHNNQAGQGISHFVHRARDIDQRQYVYSLLRHLCHLLHFGENGFYSFGCNA